MKKVQCTFDSEAENKKDKMGVNKSCAKHITPNLFYSHEVYFQFI